MAPKHSDCDGINRVHWWFIEQWTAAEMPRHSAQRDSVRARSLIPAGLHNVMSSHHMTAEDCQKLHKSGRPYSKKTEPCTADGQTPELCDFWTQLRNPPAADLHFSQTVSFCHERCLEIVSPRIIWHQSTDVGNQIKVLPHNQMCLVNYTLSSTSIGTNVPRCRVTDAGRDKSHTYRWAVGVYSTQSDMRGRKSFQFFFFSSHETDLMFSKKLQGLWFDLDHIDMRYTLNW